MVECEDREVGKMYGKVVYQFMSAMMEVRHLNWQYYLFVKAEFAVFEIRCLMDIIGEIY